MTTPETFRALLAANAVPPRNEVPNMTRNLCGKLNDYLYKCAHEPSLAGYRIQEHVHKAVPSLVKDWPTITQTTDQLNGVIFDLEYTSQFLDKLDESIRNSTQTREIISELASKVSAASSRARETTTNR